jgi:NAD+ synthase (glutamine-hydrolysing)
MTTVLRVALAQLNPTSGDIAGNTRRILDAVDAARARGADLVVTPEMAIPGYCIGDLIESSRFLEANERAMQEIARAAAGLTVVAGFVDCDPDGRHDSGGIRKYNAAAVVRDGRVLQRARKTLLPNYRYFDDKRYFTAAAVREPVAIEGPEGPVRLGVSICEDMWDEFYAVKPLQELAAKGAGVLLNINASPFYPGKRHERDALIRRHVQQSGLPLVYVNTVGAADNGKNIIPFDGESLVYDPGGRLVAAARQFEEELLVCDVATSAERPALPLPPVEREREMYDALVMGLRDYMRKTGFARAVVAISGGIDSALALAIAVDAIGADSVAAFNMPSQYNTATTQAIAARLAAELGVRYGVIPIQSINDHVCAVFEQHAHPIARGFTRENLQARIRGLLMMAESNDTDALLISCGNETEIALGYATLYGDMCGGISLIGDLSKIDVYRLARHVNDRHRAERIPEEAFTIVPSAELAANQFDPFDYHVVAPIVGELVEQRRSPSDLVALFEQRALDPARFIPDPEGRTVYDKHTPASFRTVVDDAFGRMRRSVYKRLQGPPIVVVTERAFGFDLRETIINGWEDETRDSRLETRGSG